MHLIPYDARTFEKCSGISSFKSLLNTVIKREYTMINFNDTHVVTQL